MNRSLRIQIQAVITCRQDTRSLLLLVLCWLLGSVVLEAQYDSLEIDRILFSHLEKAGLKAGDIQEYRITDQYTSSTGITHIYLLQQHQGLDIENAQLSIHLKDGKVMKVSNRMLKGLDKQQTSNVPGLSVARGLQIAAQNLGKQIGLLTAQSLKTNKQGKQVGFRFDNVPFAREPVQGELKWLPNAEGQISLVWKISIYEKDEENYWNIYVDTRKGKVLRKDNMVVHCRFDRELHLGCNGSHPPYQEEVEASHFYTMDSAYRVFPLTVESPIHGERILVDEPWNHAGIDNPATTLGWHDDSLTQYTITRGNNVYAYDDSDNDGPPGYTPHAPGLAFDFPYDPELPPHLNRDASLTNMFFWSNLIHDIAYQYGFDEQAGNFQHSNLGRGGKAYDPVYAEGLDGGGINNANFLTPPDGGAPRMQMYLWSDVLLSTPVVVHSDSIADSLSIFGVESDFSTANKIDMHGPVTADLILALDTIPDSHLACHDTLANEDQLGGKIVLIDRGDCDFTVKVKRLEDMGAEGVLVANHVEGDPFIMGGDDNSITIPAFMISKLHGTELKSVLETTSVEVTLRPQPTVTPDGSFDNGIITHEYAHGISNRLTGGPATTDCLNNGEQMGEGWSDFFGLMLTTDWNVATPEQHRGIGTYALGTGVDSKGIRTYPYTTSMEINPFTYGDIANSSSVHYIGSVWATMLWDMTWEIIALEGVDTNLYHGTGGNNIAMQLVMTGMELQPCQPGFVDGRDAILTADAMLYDSAHHCAIWKAFARRGLGYSASQGYSQYNFDGHEAFDLPQNLILHQTVADDPTLEGTETTLSLSVECICFDEENIEIRQALPQGFTLTDTGMGTVMDDTLFFNIAHIEPDSIENFEFAGKLGFCASASTAQILVDDAEGDDQFESIQLSGVGAHQWVKNDIYFHGGENSWYARDFSTAGDNALTMMVPVSPSGCTRIEFYHRFETEFHWDGGVVEYSIDGGSSWIDAGPYFTQNGYPDAITFESSSELAGRAAYTGNSDTLFSTSDFIISEIELCLPQETELLLRFRFATDGTVGSFGLNGWYIDDIMVEQAPAIPFLNTLVVDGMVQDSLAFCMPIDPLSGTGLYVDQSAGGTGFGDSWMNAIPSLATGMKLAGCRSFDTLMIAEGVYLPTDDGNPAVLFEVPDSAVLFGGFPAGGSAIELRDPAVHMTIFSGDIGVQGNSADNSHIVVSVPSDTRGAILDGLIIRDARPDPGQTEGYGPLEIHGEVELRNTEVKKTE